jgi:hypothetical protein
MVDTASTQKREKNMMLMKRSHNYSHDERRVMNESGWVPCHRAPGLRLKIQTLPQSLVEDARTHMNIESYHCGSMAHLPFYSSVISKAYRKSHRAIVGDRAFG